jgi:hypothetical protein
MNQEWTFAHTIECGVSPEFAWNFWTNVRNWALDADIESVELLGTFAAGGRGVTHSKSSGKVEWRILEVIPPRKAVLEFPAPGAVAKFVWTFEDANGRTRITQLATLSGEQMAHYAETIGPALRTGIPAGMRKLCEAMQAAGRASPR